MEAYFACVAFAEPPLERVPLDDAAGRVLGAPLFADQEYPSAARSAMDGYAILAASAPAAFRLRGEIAMGHLWQGRLDPLEALAVPTGGTLPPGTDAVVPVEEAGVDGGLVRVGAAVAAGENVTPAGSDMHRGDRVAGAGRRLNGALLGVLATLGIVDVPVYRRPLVAVLSSGDELVAPSQRPRPGEIRDSNRYAVAASLRAMGACVRHYPTVSDGEGLLQEALREALAGCDAVVMTGGSSVGERDRAPQAVAELGEPGVVVHGLRIKPGKPTLLGAVGSKPVVGLPGNPLSALLVLEAVAAPIVAALAGAPAPAASCAARLGEAVRGRRGWTWYVPVALRHDGEAAVAHPLPLRSSSVSLAARADGYVVVAEHGELAAGESVTVHRFLGS